LEVYDVLDEKGYKIKNLTVSKSTASIPAKANVDRGGILGDNKQWDVCQLLRFGGIIWMQVCL